MTWSRGRGPAMAITGLTVLAALACSSSDPIQPNNGNLTLVIENVPAYAAQFQWARLQIDQITLRPVDPLANSYLAIPLGLLQTPVAMDVRSAGPATIGSVPVKAGAYRLETIRVSTFSLNVDPEPPVAPVACNNNGELIAARPEGVTLLQFAPASQAPLIQVPQGGTVTLDLSIDGAGVVTMLTNLPYSCSGSTFPTPSSAAVAPLITVN